MSFKQPGPWLFALGMVGLGLVALQLLWAPGAGSAPGWWLVAPIVLILGGGGLLIRRTLTCAAIALAVYWLAWLVLQHIPALVGAPDRFPLWVSAAQALTFAMVSAAFVRPVLWPIARFALGAMVTMFGAIHALYPEVVSGLLPGWFPLPGIWPYLSGAIQIVGGLAILVGYRATMAAFVIGLMWLSWIPLVHLPRLIAAPDALFEWTFMLTALALAGAAWSVGERSSVPPGEVLQPSVR